MEQVPAQIVRELGRKLTNDGQPNARFQPRRHMITPAADGCKSLLDRNQPNRLQEPCMVQEFFDYHPEALLNSLNVLSLSVVVTTMG